MRYVYNRNKFFEAIKDELNPHQLARAKEVWGKDILNLERADPTDSIERGKWKLDSSDTKLVVNTMFSTDIDYLVSLFDNDVFREYLEFLKLSIVEEDSSWYYKNIIDFDTKKLNFTDIVALFGKYYRTPNIKETQNDIIILRDESGKPILDENNKIQKIEKTEDQKADIIWNNNQLVNAFALMEYYNDLYDKNLDANSYISMHLTNLHSLRHDGLKGDFQLYPTKPMYLYITEKSTDIMNISVSKFYTSCQELYTGGGHGTTYMDQLIYNLFDPNSIPAFIIYDEPYLNEYGDAIVDYMPLCRRMIRNVTDEYNESLGLFFDKTYPERMDEVLLDIIEKYTTNRHSSSVKSKGYRVNLDIPDEVDAKSPYLDSIRHGGSYRVRGLNSKTLTLDRYFSLKSIKFAKTNNISKLEFETSGFEVDDLNELIKNLPKLNTLVFKHIRLYNLPIIDNKYRYVIDKCIIDDEFFLNIVGIEDLKIKSSKFNTEELYKIESIKNLSLLYVPIKLDKDYLDKLDSFEYSEDVYYSNKEVIDSLKIKKKLIKV